MTIAVRFGRGTSADKPLLVLGPSLGTSATTLWSAAADRLAEHFHILAWELPGHGLDRAVPDGPVSIADLAAGVLELVDEVGERRFHYAGDSVGGAVGLQLLLDAPDRVASAVLLCTGAVIGSEQVWTDRVAAVRSGGTAGLVEASAGRWFGPGFVGREPDRAGALLHALSGAADEGYAAVCGALAAFDVRDRLGEIGAPVLAVAGAEDAVTPVDGLREIADGVRDGRLEVLDGVAHLAPAEAPVQVAALVLEHALGIRPDPGPQQPAAVPDAPAAGPSYDAGMAVRREVLGDAHVDRATAATTAFTADFQQFVTEHAWGSVWTREGLDRRSRSMITITAMVALGHQEELAMHVRAARTNGLSVEEIREVILHSAVYCGVPAANTAFRVAQEVLIALGDVEPPA
ncbi:bifunctional 3-oxoadipate enol-lactonase/4-carboxymuconolactone decarboxylase PcaDC [Nocardioides sp. AX2bis]|uniref:bifunctional 3-oxoadipate enol-lactonase/4-carboxymuconolactone decarboxylase PcaDC n=1 Tax=Nocardioides sp. AX2bis TaxID=2653157 RepID=UPI0012F1D0A2|nr:4-carboxymuconolactone decarboxylase [Nocardioides sp. AX2bis]VXC57805.1 4-carboxymuconolactone decarboxylase [Nocardioides sp. AX2bis]